MSFEYDINHYKVTQLLKINNIFNIDVLIKKLKCIVFWSDLQF